MERRSGFCPAEIALRGKMNRIIARNVYYAPLFWGLAVDLLLTRLLLYTFNLS
jgi:hypothetical protein